LPSEKVNRLWFSFIAPECIGCYCYTHHVTVTLIELRSLL
jgi:hypothetical protein